MIEYCEVAYFIEDQKFYIQYPTGGINTLTSMNKVETTVLEQFAGLDKRSRKKLPQEVCEETKLLLNLKASDPLWVPQENAQSVMQNLKSQGDDWIRAVLQRQAMVFEALSTRRYPVSHRRTSSARM